MAGCTVSKAGDPLEYFQDPDHLVKLCFGRSVVFLPIKRKNILVPFLYLDKFGAWGVWLRRRQ
jgi:hypothetical protein